MILMSMERWGPAAGCVGFGLVDSGRTQGAEETEVGRRFHSETVRGGEEGIKEDRMLGLCLVKSLCSSGPRVGVAEETCWVDVYKAVVDFVEHPQADLSSLKFKTCPIQIFEHGCNSAW